MLQHRLVIVAVLTLLGLASRGTSYADSSKDDYELQERCGKRAEESFRREWGNGIKSVEGEKMSADYSNHYNKKLNKCFVLLSVSGMSKKYYNSIMLYDVNESRTYGSFFKLEYDRPPNQCQVLGKKCKSEDEWNSFVRPYMEE